MEEFVTVSLNTAEDAVVIVDQTLLPGELKYIELRSLQELFEAIYSLRVRGAPAIGVAAAYGLYLCARELQDQPYDRFIELLRQATEYLASARPTAVNLSWALGRMFAVAAGLRGHGTAEIVSALLNESRSVAREDEAACRAIGEHCLRLLTPGMSLLTHCNAGSLATVRLGTATAAMYLGHQRGYGFKIYCDETRPLLQGARLTAYELSRAGMDVTLLCDNMAASLMKAGKIDAVLVGADRIAKNGDTANKIGTLPLAICAERYGVPFYVCAPASTLDPAAATGSDIIIEQRPASEIREAWYERPMAPEGISVYNPAFDVTDYALITAIITERGAYIP